MESKAQSTNNGVGSGQLEEMPGTYPHFSLAIMLLYGMNTGLAKLTAAAGIQFPSALIGRRFFFVSLGIGIHGPDSVAQHTSVGA